MIRLKYQVIINSEPMMDGFDRLMKHSGFPIKVAKNIARIAANIDQNSNRIRKEFQTMLKEQGLMDLKGVPIPDKDVTAEKKEKWRKMQEDFGEKEFTIDREKILFADIEGVGLTPREILAIEPFVEGLEDRPAPPNKKERKLKEVRA